MTNRTPAIFDEFSQGQADLRKPLQWTIGTAQIRVKLSDIDRLGCLLDWAELKPASAKELNIEPESIERSFTYLGESLVLIEHAKREGRAVFRSNPPLREGSQIEYYELLVDRHEGLSLTRYAYDSVDRRRTPKAAHLTTHALGRLIDDLKHLAEPIETKAPSR